MDNNFDVPLDESVQNQPVSGLHISNDIRMNLREFSLWTLILAILGVISLGQNLLLFVFKKSVETSVVSTLLTLLFGAFIAWLYYRMHQTSKVLSTSNSSEDIDATATALKNFFMTLGIIMIIAMVVMVAVIMFVFMVGVGRITD